MMLLMMLMMLMMMMMMMMMEMLDDGDVRCRSGRRVVVRGATVPFRQPPPIFESLTRQNEY